MQPQGAVLLSASPPALSHCRRPNTSPVVWVMAGGGLWFRGERWGELALASKAQIRAARSRQKAAAPLATRSQARRSQL